MEKWREKSTRETYVKIKIIYIVPISVSRFPSHGRHYREYADRVPQSSFRSRQFGSQNGIDTH